MDRTLSPEVERYIDEQVKAGRFASASQLLDEAVSRMMLAAEEDDEIDDDTAAAINRAEEQLDRGEGVELDQARADMRRRIGSR